MFLKFKTLKYSEVNNQFLKKKTLGIHNFWGIIEFGKLKKWKVFYPGGF